MICDTVQILLLLLVVIILFYIYNSGMFEHFEDTVKKENGIIDHLGDVAIHVVNLKERTDRKEKMTSQFNKYNISAIFEEAVNGKNVNIDEMINNGIIRYQDGDRIMRSGEIGCYFSHLNILNKFLKSDKKYVLIFEDDAILEDNFRDDLIKVLDDVNKNNIVFDMLFLSTNCDTDWRKLTCTGKNISTTIYQPVHLGYGMHSYIVSREGAHKLLDAAYPIRWPIDVLVEVYHDNKKMTIYKTIKQLSHINDAHDSDTVKIK